MSLEFISVKCPDCGATLNIEDGREFAFCTYCGAKVILHNENEHIYRHIDEAGIKQAETERLVRMKQLELVEKKQADERKTRTLKVIISLTLATIGILMMVIGNALGHASGDPNSSYHMVSLIGFFPLLGAAYVWIFSTKKSTDEEVDLGDMAKVPSSISEYEKKSYSAIEAMFIGAGFTNIKCVPLNDLTVGILKKPGMVESITINGHTISSGGKKYPKDAPVIITYHSLSR